MAGSMPSSVEGWAGAIRGRTCTSSMVFCATEPGTRRKTGAKQQANRAITAQRDAAVFREPRLEYGMCRSRTWGLTDPRPRPSWRAIPTSIAAIVSQVSHRLAGDFAALLRFIGERKSLLTRGEGS